VIDFQAALLGTAPRCPGRSGDSASTRRRLEDERGLEVPALEVVLGPTLQPLHKSVQDLGPPPVRRRSCDRHAQRAVNATSLRQDRAESIEVGLKLACSRSRSCPCDIRVSGPQGEFNDIANCAGCDDLPFPLETREAQDNGLSSGTVQNVSGNALTELEDAGGISADRPGHSQAQCVPPSCTSER
jgi:hypothetical protein